MSNLISAAIKQVGLQPLSTACDVTYQALRKWEAKKRLPYTEATGQTDYAAVIEKATGGKISKEALMRWSFPDLKRKAA